MSLSATATDLESSDLRFARAADRLLLLALLAAGAVALAVATHYGGMGLAVGISALLLGGAGLVYAMAGGTLASRLVLAGSLAGMVALHIQLGRGTLEFHFGVFVTLAILLIYRDWRPIVAAAALFAVHHIVFDRLQASGWGVYCTPEADFVKVLMHAGYVVVQTGLEVFMAVSMRHVARAGHELEAMVKAMDAQGAVSLDLGGVAASTPIAVELKQLVARMRAAMQEVQASASNIQTASTEIASGTLDLSTRTEQTAANLQQAASSVAQLSSAVKQTASSAHAANDLALNAAGAAGRGGEVVARVVTTMGDINSSSKKIADIIGTIDGIAFQTNILALNAAVEAARAGEQGRGFAVVASEVRALAQRSATAAREIKALIGNSVSCADDGARLVGDAGSTMSTIVSSVHSVSQMIAEIRTASEEQAQGIAQVSGAVDQLEQMTQQNAALVEQSSAAAESLRVQAQRLGEVLQGFRLRVT